MKDEKSAKFESIYEQLLKEIQNGNYLPGSKLPTEKDLAARFVVSRNTLRQALMLLTQEGYISNQQGRGTFVLQNIPESASSYDQISNPMLKCAKTPVNRIAKEFSIQNTNSEIREKFGFDASKLLIKLCISYLADDRMIGHADAYVPYDLMAESKVPLDDADAVYDFYEYLISRSDIKGTSMINIDMTDEDIRKTMEIQDPEPLMRISESYRDKNGYLVLIQDLYMRMTDYEIRIHKPFRI